MSSQADGAGEVATGRAASPGVAERLALALLHGCMLLMAPLTTTAGDTSKPERDGLRLHVVFDNVASRPGLRTSWGFACLVEGPAQTILFDTGGDGDFLLANMRELGLEPGAVDVVVLSHVHWDHTGGLAAFLARNPGVTVYVPASFPASFARQVTARGAELVAISGPRRLVEDVYSTGVMGSGTEEQGLILDTPRGLVVVTGCAHPGVADMAERAQAYLGRRVYLLAGGFHLGGGSEAEIRALIARLEALGVSMVAPSHCTGARAIRMFSDAWRGDFVEGGLGAVIEIPGPSGPAGNR